MSHADEKWQRLGDGSLLTEDADEGLGHIVPLKTYWMVYASLIFLTAVTVFAATLDFGSMNLIIAILIASVKAGIVTLIFMHLKFEGLLIWSIVIYPLFILGLLIVGTLGDRSVKEVASPAVSIVDYQVPSLPPVVDLHHGESDHAGDSEHDSSSSEDSH